MHAKHVSMNQLNAHPVILLLKDNSIMQIVSVFQVIMTLVFLYAKFAIILVKNVIIIINASSAHKFLKDTH